MGADDEPAENAGRDWARQVPGENTCVQKDVLLPPLL